MGDDGEKFGARPGTDELSWGSGRWVEDCFGALEHNATWLATVTPAQWLERQPPRGRIYVPTASYVEMTEWALPPDQAIQFHRLLSEAEAADTVAARFLKGAMWRNFQARYREVNDLHKQMLRASRAVEAMPAGAERELALDHLYRGQSNDCYWHGLFGGIYIVHMRMATLHHLIAAEDLASGGEPLHGVGDHDLDGIDEVLLGTVGQTVLVDVAEGGGIGAWDLRASRVALASVMRRRPEAYHEQLRRVESTASAAAAGEQHHVVNPHEQLMAKEHGLSRYLVYDDHERRSGLVRLLVDGRPVGDLVSGPWILESATPSEARLRRDTDSLRVVKHVRLAGGRLDPTLALDIELTAADALSGELEIEWNINLSGGGANPDAYYRGPAGESRHDSSGSLQPGAGELAMGNRYEGVELRLSAHPAPSIRWSAVETVSNSEAGFERIYQGSCLILRWPLELRAGEVARFSVELHADQARDRTADELRGEAAARS